MTTLEHLCNPVKRWLNFELEYILHFISPTQMTHGQDFFFVHKTCLARMGKMLVQNYSDLVVLFSNVGLL